MLPEPESAFRLGENYAFGRGVPQDRVLAYMWFTVAADQGHESAARNRDSVAKDMTPEEILEAARLARDWPPKGRGLRPRFVSLIGLVFATASGVITYSLSDQPLAGLLGEYIQHHGPTGSTMFAITNAFFELFVVPGFFIITYAIVVPILYASKRKIQNAYLNVWLISGAVLLVEAFVFWAFIGSPNYLLILGGQALGVTAVFCVVFCVLLNRILKRDDAESASEKA